MRRDCWGQGIDFLVDLVCAGGGGGGRHGGERIERRLGREREREGAREKKFEIYLLCVVEIDMLQVMLLASARSKSSDELPRLTGTGRERLNGYLVPRDFWDGLLSLCSSCFVFVYLRKCVFVYYDVLLIFYLYCLLSSTSYCYL